MKKILIIPTYNEIDNIESIHKKIRKYNSRIKILFIDDNSPDGTLDKIKLLIKNDKNILILSRKRKYGIGSAHKFGIRWAIKKKFKLCVTMDSDMTHDPKLIPKMIKLSNKYDLVQTNRFLNKKLKVSI
jgi:dolichol-phosphate mannosyltransferase